MQVLESDSQTPASEVLFDVETTDVAPHVLRGEVLLRFNRRRSQRTGPDLVAGSIVDVLEQTHLEAPHRSEIVRFLHLSEPVSDLQPHAQADRGSVEAAREIHRGVGAVADLRDWLGVSIDAICRAAGFSPSTLYHWVEHPTTRPRMSTISRLIALWSLAGMVRHFRGPEGSLTWWHEGSPSRWDALLADGPDRLGQLQDEVAALAGADEPLPVPRAPLSAEEARSAMLALFEA